MQCTHTSNLNRVFSFFVKKKTHPLTMFPSIWWMCGNQTKWCYDWPFVIMISFYMDRSRNHLEIGISQVYSFCLPLERFFSSMRHSRSWISWLCRFKSKGNSLVKHLMCNLLNGTLPHKRYYYFSVWHFIFPDLFHIVFVVVRFFLCLSACIIIGAY